MSNSRLVMAVMGIGILALAVGLFVPSLIDAQTQDARDPVALSPGDNATYNELIRVDLNSINSTANTANVTVKDLTTFNETSFDIAEGDNTTVDPANEGDIDIELLDLESDSAELQPSFDQTYGWNRGATLFINEFDTIMVLTGFVVMLGGLGAVMRP